MAYGVARCSWHLAFALRNMVFNDSPPLAQVYNFVSLSAVSRPPLCHHCARHHDALAPSIANTHPMCLLSFSNCICNHDLSWNNNSIPTCFPKTIGLFVRGKRPHKEITITGLLFSINRKKTPPPLPHPRRRPLLCLRRR